MIKPIRTFYLPSGRVILSKVKGDYPIESTEMRDISVDGKQHSDVRESLDPRVVWKHSIDVQDKWLLTVSTQKGCVHNCKFCDVAPLSFKGNLTGEEILEQIMMLVASTPEIMAGGTRKAKIGFARMGEPAHNFDNVTDLITKYLVDKQAVTMKSDYTKNFNKANKHIDWLPCFNSILPMKTTEGLTGEDIIRRLLNLKEKKWNGKLHFQISCNSTDEEVRKKLFGGADVLPLEKLIEIVNKYPITNRTVTLNFIVMQGVPINIDYLIRLGLNPEKFAVKLIPLNRTDNAEKNNLETVYNYNNYEELQKYAEKFAENGIPVVYDAIAKCEEAGLCCGQLAHICV